MISTLPAWAPIAVWITFIICILLPFIIDHPVSKIGGSLGAAAMLPPFFWPPATQSASSAFFAAGLILLLAGLALQKGSRDVDIPPQRPKGRAIEITINPTLDTFLWVLGQPPRGSYPRGQKPSLKALFPQVYTSRLLARIWMISAAPYLIAALCCFVLNL